jgi:hypothetical protein
MLILVTCVYQESDPLIAVSGGTFAHTTYCISKKVNGGKILKQRKVMNSRWSPQSLNGTSRTLKATEASLTLSVATLAIACERGQ